MLKFNQFIITTLDLLNETHHVMGPFPFYIVDIACFRGNAACTTLQIKAYHVNIIQRWNPTYDESHLVDQLY